MTSDSEDYDLDDWMCPDYLNLEDPAEGRRCWVWSQIVQVQPNTKMDDILKAAASLEAYLEGGTGPKVALKVVKK